MFMIDVFGVHISHQEDEIYFEKLIAFLSTDRQHQIHRFRRKEDARRAILSEAMIRLIIISRLDIRNQDIVLVKNEYGKPFLKDYPDFQFNVSHSGEWVVCAVHHLPVGIDVEQIQPMDMKIAQRFFSDQEYCDLMERNQAEQLLYFFDLWTLKESYIKALGKGLSIPLDSFSLQIAHGDISLKTDTLSMNWFFKQYDIDPGYKMSVCGSENDFCPTVAKKRICEIYNGLANDAGIL